MFVGLLKPNQSKTDDAADATTDKPEAKVPTTGTTDAADAMVEMVSSVEEIVPFSALASDSLATEVWERLRGICRPAKPPGGGVRKTREAAAGREELATGSWSCGLTKLASKQRVMVVLTPGAVSWARGDNTQTTKCPSSWVI